MPGQLSDVAQAAAGFHDLLGYSRDERAPPEMRTRAAESQFLIQPMKPHLHRIGAHAGVAPAVDDVIVTVEIAMSVPICARRSKTTSA